MLDKIESIGVRITSMTIDEIVIETGKSRRAVFAYLTRRGISIKDYDGAAKKEKARLRSDVKDSADESVAKLGDKKYVSPILTQISLQESDARVVQVVTLVLGAIWVALSCWGFWINGWGFLLFCLLLGFGLFMVGLMLASSISDSNELKAKSVMNESGRATFEESKAARRKATQELVEESQKISSYGPINKFLKCPHCTATGTVRSKGVNEVSSTKIIPIVGNNIKTRRQVTQLHCSQCNITWNV